MTLQLSCRGNTKRCKKLFLGIDSSSNLIDIEKLFRIKCPMPTQEQGYRVYITEETRLLSRSHKPGGCDCTHFPCNIKPLNFIISL